jgi:RimJ/RimL family protein N-acetyltransferase
MNVPPPANEQLRLRAFRHHDASWVYYVSQDPALRQALSLPEPYKHEHARYFVDHVALANPDGADFVIEDMDTEIALGWVGLHRKDGSEFGCGFWLAAGARGRGIMTQALRMACRWAFSTDGLTADVIHWQAHVGNYASRTVAERVGFKVDSAIVQGRHGEKWSGRLRAADFRR